METTKSFKNNEKFTKQEFDQLRPILNTYGALYGKSLVYAKSDNVDKKHNEKVKNNAIHLSSPIKMFTTEYIVMTSFELDKDPNDKPVLIVNHDPDLTFPVVGNENPKVMDCSAEKINEALRNCKEFGKITFFTDVENVATMVMNINSRTAEDLQSYAEELINQAGMLRNVNKTEASALKEYQNSLKQ